MPMEEISDKLEEFKRSGLIADYEILVADDSMRTRVVAPAGANVANLKAFLVDALGATLSESQINVEASGAGGG
ncbi:MAG: hypothetical protein IT538_04705 [Variibacter sp.]|nr:hypothetical protein [Variibacter sp.]